MFCLYVSNEQNNDDTDLGFYVFNDRRPGFALINQHLPPVFT